MYIYHCPCFQSIQFTWKQVGYLASKMMLHRILHLLYFAVLTQYFCSLCDISKTVFVIKWDYFDLHYRCYFSWCMLRLFVMKKGCVSYMFLWWICFWGRFPVLLLSNLFLERQKTKRFFERCIITLTSVWLLCQGEKCFNNCYLWLSDIYSL